MDIETNEVFVTTENAFQKHALEYIFFNSLCMVLLRVLPMDSLNIKRLCGWHEHY